MEERGGKCQYCAFWSLPAMRQSLLYFAFVRWHAITPPDVCVVFFLVCDPSTNECSASPPPPPRHATGLGCAWDAYRSHCSKTFFFTNLLYVSIGRAFGGSKGVNGRTYHSLYRFPPRRYRRFVQRAKYRFIFTSILQRPVTQPEVLLDRVRQIHEQTFALRPVVVVVSHINSCQKSRVRGHTKVLEP